MLLKLKRETITSFGNSYPTPVIAFNLGSHSRPLGSLTGPGVFTTTGVLTTFPKNSSYNTRTRNGVCAQAKLEPQPLGVRTPPPPPRCFRLRRARFLPGGPSRPLLARSWSRFSAPPVTALRRCPRLSACADCRRPSPWQRQLGALVSDDPRSTELAPRPALSLAPCGGARGALRDSSGSTPPFFRSSRPAFSACTLSPLA